MTPKDPRFVMLDAESRNGGMPSAQLAESYLTPTLRCFLRSHAEAAPGEEAGWELRVLGLVRRPLRLSIPELLARYPRREVAATLICAGIRREEFLRLGPLPGELPWGAEPVSTCRWSGVSLADLLAEAGVREGAAHVAFTGADRVERHGHQFGFGGSISLDKARDPDVLLATTMNGEPLAAEHGFPLRAVVPGWVGARSVKWLTEIEVRSVPSDNYFQTQAYRIQRHVNPEDPRDVRAGMPLAEVPLNSVITTPPRGAAVAAGGLEVRGWAIGPEATAPARVELSTNDGLTWAEVTVDPADDRWTWRLWRARVELAPGRHRLVVRAWDMEGRTQPATIEETWNVKGYLNNAWFRMDLEVVGSARSGTGGA